MRWSSEFYKLIFCGKQREDVTCYSRPLSSAPNEIHLAAVHQPCSEYTTAISISNRVDVCCRQQTSSRAPEFPGVCFLLFVVVVCMLGFSTDDNNQDRTQKVPAQTVHKTTKNKTTKPQTLKPQKVTPPQTATHYALTLTRCGSRNVVNRSFDEGDG